MKTVKLYNGRIVQVPDADYEDFIGHLVTEDSKDPESAIAEYISTANFSQFFEMSAGHIDKIEYAPTRTLLKVSFNKRGDVVVFFRVPRETFGELNSLKESGTMKDKRGVPRHLMGMRFWDIVRVRGTVHSARYKFEYVTHGTGGTGKAKSTYAVDSQTEVAKEAKRTGTSEEAVYKDMTSVLDGYTHMLSPSLVADYKNLKNADAQKEYLAKEKFMQKHGII
jgi:hypothetical protein